jgi:REP element-mobilizing transposase RayT
MAWSTRLRKPLIDDAVAPSLYAYIGGVLRECDSTLLAAGGTSDHIHLLCDCSKNHGASKIVKEVKVASSLWAKTQGETLREFHWQAGYAAFSVSPSNIGRVTEYIDSQHAHHEKRSFQDELRALLKRHAIAFDERYLWE